MAESKLERNKRLAREWFETIGRKEWDKLRPMASDDFAFFPMCYTKVDFDTFAKMERAHMEPMPDYKVTITNVIGEGDWVAVHWIHDGHIPDDVDEYVGLKITKRHQYHDIMCILKFTEDGKVCEKHAKYNMVRVLEQMGVKEIEDVLAQMKD